MNLIRPDTTPFHINEERLKRVKQADKIGFDLPRKAISVTTVLPLVSWKDLGIIRELDLLTRKMSELNKVNMQKL